ncbi:sulfurtransferase [Salinicoccus hispanicus]|uniref:thiosulfate sulfurtransferase n=1 Tax=Salinicoccus hispanicus TaxID=157225 RepID=A0A6N8TWL0_9STAP|nr:rhodanese-like domain-containing protein [Salinicoccus hispanicus]MXQ50304.1 sulfurtransferase [Salinicoccus hispanicus]
MTIIDRTTVDEQDFNTLIPVDCRNVMDDMTASLDRIAESPVEGAVHIPQYPWMFDDEGLNHGRHPVPVRSIVEKLHESLVQASGEVPLLFDDEQQFFHTRLYYLFRLYGLDAMLWNDSVDSLETLSTSFGSTTPALPGPNQSRTGDYSDVQIGLLVLMEDVKEAVHDEDVLLIDVRSRERYLGLEEPIDRKMGHIPGAVNIPYGSFFTAGRMDFASHEHMRHFLDSFKEIIVYCGSGMSATPPFLVLQEMGLPVRLYGGSFSEWITDDNNTIETGDAPLNERILSLNE